MTLFEARQGGVQSGVSLRTSKFWYLRQFHIRDNFLILSFWLPDVRITIVLTTAGHFVKNGPLCWKNSPSFWLFGSFLRDNLWPRIDKKHLMSKLLSFWRPDVKITIVLTTSGHFAQKRTVLLKEFPVILTFWVVFTVQSWTSDWQKVPNVKISIVWTRSCQNHCQRGRKAEWRVLSGVSQPSSPMPPVSQTPRITCCWLILASFCKNFPSFWFLGSFLRDIQRIEECFPGCHNHPPLHTWPSTPVSQTPRITCFWYTHFRPPSILDKIVRISKLLWFWQPHVKITIVLRTSGH